MFVGGPEKKSFLYFSSDAGKGFIISDDEEVTGVISVRNKDKKKTKKRHPSFREKITESITDTLTRKGKKKIRKRTDIPIFLYVNKPHFSSESSLEVSCSEPSQAAVRPEYLQEGNTERRGKHFRSEIRLRIQTRWGRCCFCFYLLLFFSRPDVQAIISSDSPYSVGGDREHG